ncbi:histidine phosphatase family protein [Candidatus Campbellbacteria bacterium]|nr:MAG: histidine phosphatase family protein [Candidatus Campbellbacteria bacterium]
MILFFSSTLKRALETAEILKKHIDAPIIIDDRLIERDFGLLTGKNWNEIEKEFSETAHNDDRAQKYDYTRFGGESAEDVKRRLLAFLDFIKKEYGSKKILIVAHGGIMKMLQRVYTQEIIFTPENGTLQTFDI